MLYKSSTLHSFIQVYILPSLHLSPHLIKFICSPRADCFWCLSEGSSWTLHNHCRGHLDLSSLQCMVCISKKTTLWNGLNYWKIYQIQLSLYRPFNRPSFDIFHVFMEPTYCRNTATIGNSRVHRPTSRRWRHMREDSRVLLPLLEIREYIPSPTHWTQAV